MMFSVDKWDVLDQRRNMTSVVGKWEALGQRQVTFSVGKQEALGKRHRTFSVSK